MIRLHESTNYIKNIDASLKVIKKFEDRLKDSNNLDLFMSLKEVKDKLESIIVELLKIKE